MRIRSIAPAPGAATNTAPPPAVGTVTGYGTPGIGEHVPGVGEPVEYIITMTHLAKALAEVGIKPYWHASGHWCYDRDLAKRYADYGEANTLATELQRFNLASFVVLEAA